MGHYEVGIGLLEIGRGREACITPLRPPMMNIAMNPTENRNGVVNRTAPAPDGADPVKDFYACWNGDQHGGYAEERVGYGSHADGEHVMGPDAERHDRDGDAPE